MLDYLNYSLMCVHRWQGHTFVMHFHPIIPA